MLPYFRGVLRGMRAGSGRAYPAEVYGIRNVCTRVSETYGLQHPFVSDMSTAYSGNMGFALPVNWSIDQVVTVSVPYAGGTIQVDRDVWYQSDSPLHLGGDDDDWIHYVHDDMASAGRTAVLAVSDPWTGQRITVDHMAYGMQAALLHGLPPAPDPNRADVAGWGGDLITTFANCLSDDLGYATPRAYASAMICPSPSDAGTGVRGATPIRMSRSAR